MRRAGYEVRALPEEDLGWEENPPTLIEFIRRDLRWCQGNMQYWRLVGGLPGLLPLSRFQIGMGIFMYLAALAWTVMIVLSALKVFDPETGEVMRQLGVRETTMLATTQITPTAAGVAYAAHVGIFFHFGASMT